MSYAEADEILSAALQMAENGPLPHSLSHILNPITDADNLPSFSTWSQDLATTDDSGAEAMDVDSEPTHVNELSTPEIDIRVADDPGHMGTNNVDRDSDMKVVAHAGAGSNLPTPSILPINSSTKIPKHPQEEEKISKKRALSSASNTTKPANKKAKDGVNSGLYVPSKAAIWQRLQNFHYLVDEMADDPIRFQRFKDTILSIDRDAIVYDSKWVRHTKCGKDHVMKSPYNTGNFVNHVKICTGPPKGSKFPGGGMKPIGAYFGGIAGPNIPSAPPTLPCPGLDERNYEQVAVYLGRTGALGGGASSVTKISMEMYGKRYAQLSITRKEQVKTAQMHEWLWKNSHNIGKVYSTQCEKLVHNATQPCRQCSLVLSSKHFKTASAIPRPSDEHYKYVNHEYRNTRLATLFGQCVGLREIIESDVSFQYLLRAEIDNQAFRTPQLHH